MSSIVDAEVTPTIEVEAHIQRWVITSDDIYIVQKEGIPPQWYQDLINSVIDNTGTYMPIEGTNGLTERFDNIDAGYSNIINNYTTNAALILAQNETLSLANDHTNAGISQLDVLKISADEATAISNTVVGAWFTNGQAAAWFDQQVSTIASTAYAAAQSSANLTASLDGQRALLEEAFGDIESLQQQVDGVVETLFYGTENGNLGPNTLGTDNIDLTAEPYVTWKADGVLAQKSGDTYVLYELEAGTGNRLVLNSWSFGKAGTVNEPTTDSEGYVWVINQSADVNDIYQQIANAQGTADGKITTYLKDGPIPPHNTGLATDDGDIWYNSFAGDFDGVYFGNNAMYRYTGSIWERVSDERIEASVTRLDEVSVDVNGTATAKSTLSHDINGRITGFVLNSINTESAMDIIADKFSITHPDTLEKMLEYDAIAGTLVNQGTFISHDPATAAYPNGDYSILSEGDLSFYKDGTRFKYLRRIEPGVCTHGVVKTVTGFFNGTPSILVTAQNITSYDPAYANSTQIMSVGYSDLAPTGIEGEYTFIPIASLNLGVGSSAENFPNYQVNHSGTGTHTTTSSSVTSAFIVNNSSVDSFTLDFATVNDGGYVHSATIRVFVQYSIDGGAWTTDTLVTHVVPITDGAALGSFVVANSAHATALAAHSWRIQVQTEMLVEATLGGTMNLSYAGPQVAFSTDVATRVAEGHLNFIAIG